MTEYDEDEQDEELPSRTEDFLRWLHQRYPHQCPPTGTPLEEIHRYAGAREMIDAMMFRAFGPDKNDWKCPKGEL